MAKLSKARIGIGVVASALVTAAAGYALSPKPVAASSCDWKYCSISNSCRSGEPKNCTIGDHPIYPCEDESCF